MNIKAVASGGNSGDGGKTNINTTGYNLYAGSGGGGAGATLKYSGNALTVSITNGKVTLTSSEGDNIVLNKGGTGSDYTNGSAGSGGTGGTKSATNINNSFTETNIDVGSAGNSPKKSSNNGQIEPTPPLGGMPGINYYNYGIGKEGAYSFHQTTISNQSVKITFVLQS